MFGLKIKNYMDSKGIKYSHIAEKTGIKMNVFSAMLNNKRKITVEEYFTICDALQVDGNLFAQKAN